jgi:hypothetical protein
MPNLLHCTSLLNLLRMLQRSFLAILTKLCSLSSHLLLHGLQAHNNISTTFVSTKLHQHTDRQIFLTYSPPISTSLAPFYLAYWAISN